ncbi:hypothetical protein PILCRDRAFT_88423 [Piloderma croceum F 1598]|uniref:Ribonuclease H1 N-terminal domain-containing protein n=1 Tax=Piloderma croceum (strain F 1598) TaxID=765440 RepID=A0A0C3FEB7_PILCF|nr:hypothetical protein PILCRDRAFT_88423 [Piloderma croceum F 1598]
MQLPAPLPPSSDEHGRRYVVVKGIVPGIYLNWGSYQQQIYRVSCTDGCSMQTPQIAWQYYKAERLAGNVEVLPPTVAVQPVTTATAKSSIPLTSPFAADKNFFVIIRRKVPGIHYSWDECVKHISDFDYDCVRAFATITDTATCFTDAQFSGESDWVDIDMLDDI